MRVIFPFAISQVSDTEVELKLDSSGQPLVEVKLHPKLEDAVSDMKLDKIYGKVIEQILLAAVKVKY